MLLTNVNLSFLPKTITDVTICVGFFYYYYYHVIIITVAAIVKDGDAARYANINMVWLTALTFQESFLLILRKRQLASMFCAYVLLLSLLTLHFQPLKLLVFSWVCALARRDRLSY